VRIFSACLLVYMNISKKIESSLVRLVVSLFVLMMMVVIGGGSGLKGFEASSVFGVEAVHAASGYSSLIVETSPGIVNVASGESKTVQVKVKNIGSETWYRNGAHYVSIYTYVPKYHVSPYRGPSWFSDHHVGGLLESSVAPGETGTMEFVVYGPPNFTGSLSETFKIAAEDIAWFDGGQFNLVMNVNGGDDSVGNDLADTVKDDVAEEEVEEVVEADGDDIADYDAITMSRVRKITARANEVVTVRVAFKNNGAKPWPSYEVRSSSSSMLATLGDDVSYRSDSWPSSVIALSQNKEVVPGAMEIVEFQMRAPHLSGSYEVPFVLAVDDILMPDAVVMVPLDVTSSAGKIIYDDTDFDRVVDGGDTVVSDLPYSVGQTIEEPHVRVGLEVLENEAIFTANNDVRVLEADARIERFIVPAGQPISVLYNGSQYYYKSGGVEQLFDNYLRFEGIGDDTIFTVTTYDDVRSWNTSLNDNRFRGVLEVRWNARRDRTWLINELPMEQYIYGLDETSNTAPVEYHRALATAARTYAMYLWETKTKYRGEYIDMKNSTADQVYHGYGAEIRRPNFIAAVEATDGQTIQYDGETIIASYFSRSDGRTRDWSEVWGREVPYAVSVPVPCEVGQTKWGHGVGLSAHGAVCFADDGWSYDQILKYFYTGVTLIKRW